MKDIHSLRLGSSLFFSTN